MGAVTTPAAAPSTPVQLVASLRLVTLVVTAVLVALGVVLLLAILPESGTSLGGLGVGLVLGVAALVGSGVVPPRRTAPMVVEQPPREVLAHVRGSAFTALVVLEVVAVLALVLNTTSAAALRRHLAHLESAVVSSGLKL